MGVFDNAWYKVLTNFNCYGVCDYFTDFVCNMAGILPSQGSCGSASKQCTCSTSFKHTLVIVEQCVVSVPLICIVCELGDTQFQLLPYSNGATVRCDLVHCSEIKQHYAHAG